MAKKLDEKKPTPGEEQRVKAKRRDVRDGEDLVEVASEDSFPASDPPAYTPITHPGRPT